MGNAKRKAEVLAEPLSVPKWAAEVVVAAAIEKQLELRAEVEALNAPQVEQEQVGDDTMELERLNRWFRGEQPATPSASRKKKQGFEPEVIDLKAIESSLVDLERLAMKSSSQVRIRSAIKALRPLLQ